MDVRVKGKHFEVQDALKTHIREKLGRLDRYLESAREADVEITYEAARSADDRYGVQATIRAGGTIIRAEQKGSDVYRAVDGVLDVLHQRLVRYKEKHYRRTGHRRPQSIGVALASAPTEPLAPARDGEENLDIVRVKQVPVKPMPAEMAIEQLELLGHDFYVFLDAATEQVNVLYRRRDGGYGLIAPTTA